MSIDAVKCPNFPPLSLCPLPSRLYVGTILFADLLPFVKRLALSMSKGEAGRDFSFPIIPFSQYSITPILQYSILPFLSILSPVFCLLYSDFTFLLDPHSLFV